MQTVSLARKKDKSRNNEKKKNAKLHAFSNVVFLSSLLWIPVFTLDAVPHTCASQEIVQWNVLLKKKKKIRNQSGEKG